MIRQNPHPELSVDQQLDARGLRCPMPLLKAKLALNQLQPGQILHLIATDPGSVRDVQSYVTLSEHGLRRFIEQDAEYHYWIEKGGV